MVPSRPLDVVLDAEGRVLGLHFDAEMDRGRASRIVGARARDHWPELQMRRHEADPSGWNVSVLEAGDGCYWVLRRVGPDDPHSNCVPREALAGAAWRAVSTAAELVAATAETTASRGEIRRLRVLGERLHGLTIAFAEAADARRHRCVPLAELVETAVALTARARPAHTRLDAEYDRSAVFRIDGGVLGGAIEDVLVGAAKRCARGLTPATATASSRA